MCIRDRGVFGRCRRLCEASFSDFDQDISSSPPLVFSGINPGSSCTILLFTGTFGTESIEFDSGNIVTTLSAEPTTSPANIVFSSVEARSFNIAWDEVPCSGQNGPITGYLLYYTNTTFSDTINITGGENRAYTLTELRPYTNYTVTVSAYNDGGTGPASNNTIQQTEQAEPTSSPENITFSSIEARSLTVSWDEVPPSGQNGPITGYLLYYTSTSFSDTINITGGENRAYTLTELRPYTNYTVTVAAYNDVGTGPTSDNRTQQTEQAEPTSSPENITFSSVESKSLIVSWNEVPHSGQNGPCLLYTSPSPRDRTRSRMPSSA